MWELIWLMLIMKIPILYLSWVVYWAVKAEPKPEQPVTLAESDDGPSPGWRPRRGPKRPGPHGHPTRTYARRRQPAVRT